MTRADFEERAAILEYDGGLSRADAESQALREILDLKLAGDFQIDPDLGELIQAERRRWHPDIASVQADLVNVHGHAYGYGHVVADGETYRPAIDGETALAALIVPAIEDGDRIDLVACTIWPQRMRSRHGIAAVVGFDAIERARETDAPLLVFDHTIRWLYAHLHGAVIVDWDRAAREIEGVRIILCAASLAHRLHDATPRCWPRPTIAFAPEKMRHAA